MFKRKVLRKIYGPVYSTYLNCRLLFAISCTIRMVKKFNILIILIINKIFNK